MNPLNRRYQFNKDDIVMPDAEIHGVTLGRTKLLFTTVDAKTTLVQLRFRLWRPGNSQLAQELSARIA